MKYLILVLFSITFIIGCSVDSRRNPASDYVQTDEPVAEVNVKLSSLRNGLIEAAQTSDMIESINHFEMDPVTRILNVNLTINYPMESLFNFAEVPKGAISDSHEIELAVSFPKTKQLAKSKYLSLQFHKFKIDGDDYLNAFEIVAAVIQTVLANSSLVDFLQVKAKDQIPADDHRALLKEILENNGIVVFHTTRKINFKLDLEQFAFLNSHIDDYKNVKLWRFSPTLFNRQEVRFKLVAGEGKPTDRWLDAQQTRISEDTRTLLQVREDLFVEYSDIENVSIIAQTYLNELLAGESINKDKVAPKYKRELNELISGIEISARDILTRENDNFTADPEYEYVQYIEETKSKIRNYVSNLDRRLSIDESILKGGKKGSKDKPLLTKYVSQDLFNGGMNFITDVEVENVNMIKKAELWMLPHRSQLQIRGEIAAPIEFITSKLDSTLIGAKVDSKFQEVQDGVPFKLTLEIKMHDYGKLGLEVVSLSLFEKSKKLEINRNSKNQKFMFDLAKMYIAQAAGAMEIELDNEVDEQVRAQNEIKEILSFIDQLKGVYSQGFSQDQLGKIFTSDIQMNPFAIAGKDHVENKKKILLGDVVGYNQTTKEFELNINPELVVDKINNVKHNIQVWGITPIYSKELDNTFLRLDIGQGLRSEEYNADMRYMSGEAENSQFSGIYYELGKERNPVDLLISLDFDYLESFVNRFLADMVTANKINIVEQAKADPGKSFYEVSNLNLEILQDKTIKLDVDIKSAKMARHYTSLWFGRKLAEDTMSLTMKLDLKSTNVDLNNKSNDLSELVYYKEAISVNPTGVRVKFGSRSLINSAISGIINGAGKLTLSNGTVKKMLLKIVNKFLKSMYTSGDNKILGHDMEKMARVATSGNEILIFLNPRLSGPAFDLHLTGNGSNLFQAIKLDSQNQTLHAALTASVSLAKSDKKELIKIFMDTHNMLKPFLEAKSKAEMQELLKDGQLVGRLVTNSDKSKMGLYKKLVKVMTKYNHVLHVTSIPHASQELKQRISATGAELIYFASVSYYMQQQMTLLINKMKQYQLTSKNDYYPTFVEARDKLKNNIAIPLINEYEIEKHDINQTIINNKISYWTYLFYPDAYFSESAYSLLKAK